MTNTETTTRLEMHWVPVTAVDGRTHMEAVWIEVGQPATAHAHAAA